MLQSKNKAFLAVILNNLLRLTFHAVELSTAWVQTLKMRSTKFLFFWWQNYSFLTGFNIFLHKMWLWRWYWRKNINFGRRYENFKDIPPLNYLSTIQVSNDKIISCLGAVLSWTKIYLETRYLIFGSNVNLFFTKEWEKHFKIQGQTPAQFWCTRVWGKKIEFCQSSFAKFWTKNFSALSSKIWLEKKMLHMISKHYNCKTPDKSMEVTCQQDQIKVLNLCKI